MFPDLKNSVESHGDCRRRKTCCKKQKPDEEFSRGTTCSGNGYSCHLPPMCNLDRPFLKSSASSLLTWTGGEFLIDNTINKCDKGDEVCCVPSTDPVGPTGPGIREP